MTRTCCHWDPASLGLNTTKQNGEKPPKCPLFLCRLCGPLAHPQGCGQGTGMGAGRDSAENKAGGACNASLVSMESALPPARQALQGGAHFPCCGCAASAVPGDPHPQADAALQRGSAGFQPCAVKTQQIWQISTACVPCTRSHPTNVAGDCHLLSQPIRSSCPTQHPWALEPLATAGHRQKG